MATRSNPPSRRAPRAKEHPQSAPDSRNNPPLSLDRIVATAIELLDAEGVDGLSMRKLADRVGSGAMSLYWHVESKEAVFDLALDSVLEYRGPPQTVEPDDWRSEIIHMLEDWRSSMLSHPWSAALLPRRALGPSVLGRLELLANSLSRAGVSDTNLNVAIWSLWNYVMGATITRTSFSLSDDDKAEAQLRLGRLTERYPTVERTRILMDDDWDGTFRDGLDLLLDGLTRRP